jgi:hypothetical protein
MRGGAALFGSTEGGRLSPVRIAYAVTRSVTAYRRDARSRRAKKPRGIASKI